MKKILHSLGITVFILVLGFSYIPIGTIFYNDFMNRYEEYERTLNENREVVKQYHSMEYKMYVDGIELSEDEFNAVLEDLSDYSVLIDKENKTIEFNKLRG